MQSRSLIIFAREPVQGLVKTRLYPAIGLAAATELYGRMLSDTATKAERLPGVDPLLFVAGDEEWFRRAFPRIPVFPQRGSDLGGRMEDAFSSQFTGGSGTVCIVGT